MPLNLTKFITLKLNFLKHSLFVLFKKNAQSVWFYYSLQDLCVCWRANVQHVHEYSEWIHPFIRKSDFLDACSFSRIEPRGKNIGCS